jgi:hypothetical protein
VPGDDEAQLARELRLLNQAQRFGSVGHPANISKLPAKEGHHQRCLKGIVVHDKNGCHKTYPAQSIPVPAPGASIYYSAH